MTNLAVGDDSFVVSIPSVLIEGTYWITVEPSSAYVYDVGVDEIALRADNTDLDYSEGDSFAFDGANWVADTGVQLVFLHEGFTYDLRTRITAGETSSLIGVGVFYGNASLKEESAEPFIEVFKLNGDDNVTEITLTKFFPNPATTWVIDVNTGQALRFPVWDVEGRKIIFADEQFLSPGEEVIIHVINMNGVWDNGSANANLLAENRLGSRDSSQDRSRAGEGPLLRADNGKLVEASLKEISPGSGTYEWVYAEVPE
jgi:hypothetical protein